MMGPRLGMSLEPHVPRFDRLRSPWFYGISTTTSTLQALSHPTKLAIRLSDFTQVLVRHPEPIF